MELVNVKRLQVRNEHGRVIFETDPHPTGVFLEDSTIVAKYKDKPPKIHHLAGRETVETE